MASVPVARSAYGSLNRSKTVDGSPLNAVATPDQKLFAFGASGIGFWQVAVALAHAGRVAGVDAVGPVQVEDRDDAVRVQQR